MRTLAILTAFLVLPLGTWTQADDARQPAEGVLRSNAPVAEKEAACRRLKGIGTAASAPVLASLLADESLSQWARDALESMPWPEAGAALRTALPQAKGAALAGLIDSLGRRGDTQAIAAIARALADPDPMVARAAATALGRIGGTDARLPLLAAKAQAPAAVRPAVLDGLLRCAAHLLAAGDSTGASALYRELNRPTEARHIRVAAFRGLVLASGKGAVRLVTDALMGADPEARLAALGLASEVGGKEATAAFGALMAKAAPDLQVALIGSLVQRADPAAQAGIAAAARSRDASVRVAALAALGDLGDASQVAFLADTAAGSTGPVQETARQSLVRLGRGDVRAAMLALLPKAKAATRAELIQALAARGDRRAAPALLKIAEGPDEPAALASLQALAQLAEDTQSDALLRLMTHTRSDAVRESVEGVLVAVGTRGKRQESLSASVLRELPQASIRARCALLRVAGALGGPGVLEALRAAVKDPNAEIHDSAIRTLAECGGLDAMPDLLALAKQAPTPANRVQALRGYWRLVGLAADRPAPERLALCGTGLAACDRPEERRAGLAELARVPHPGALRLAQQVGADEALRGEADLAMVQIAAGILSSDRTVAEPVLRQLAAKGANEQARADAKAALDALDRYARYLMPWLCAGPYRQEGKECQALFDIPFPPEKPDGGAVAWRPAPTPADPALFWQVDLLPIVAGNHAVAYIKTRVYSPREQDVRVEMGADDGIKLWVNGALIHANNAVRGLVPDQDKAPAHLKQGWNDFLAKITQHTIGCGACARLVTPGGGEVEGIRVDPKGE